MGGNFKRWWKSGFGAELLPIIPPGAKLREGSTVTDTGKTPGRRNSDGTWSGLGGKWADTLRPDAQELRQWQASGASLGMQTRAHPVIDIDVNHVPTADAIEALAFQILGRAPVRYRDGSSRRALLYRLKDGEAPFRKRHLKWHAEDGETTDAVDGLGYGQQFVCEGPHPKGGHYAWREDEGHPCDIGAEDLTEITRGQWDHFFVELVALLEMYGLPLAANKGSGASGSRKSLADASLHAPSPELVLDALAGIPCTPETFEDRDAFVAFLVAVKASLGAEADGYWAPVLEWALGYPGAEEPFIAKIWDSVKDAELGWDWLAGFARGHGWHGDAQADFGDNTSAETTAATAEEPSREQDDPNAGIPETPYDRMLAKYVWVKSLGQYNDIEDGSFLGSKDFNAANVDVKPFGSSGQQSAEAVFQNAPGARKVVTATSRPGEGVITKEANDKGVVVSAVNLWRTSTAKPNRSAGVNDVTQWLDLVEALFGKGTPECEHFLNWWAYVLQHPGQKIGHALVIIGGQGVGKDTVLKPLFEAVGLHNVASIDTSTLLGQWTYFLKSQIVYLQEAMTFGRRDLYNMLKPFVSAQATRLSVNEKHMRQYFVPNNQNWVVTSNHDNAIALEDDDRRFWVHRVLIEEPPEGEYFAKLYAWFKRGGIESVFGWLLNRDIGSFNPMAPPPMTGAKRTMLEQSQPAPVRWLRNLFVEGGAFAGRTVLIAGDLLRIADQDLNAPQGINHKHVGPALKSEGFKLAHRVRIGGDVRQLWIRDHTGRLSQLSPDALRDRYLSEADGQKAGKAA